MIVASRFSERVQAYRKSLKCLVLKVSAQPGTSLANFDSCARKLRKKENSCKTFDRKPVLINFVNLAVSFDQDCAFYSSVLMLDYTQVYQQYFLIMWRWVNSLNAKVAIKQKPVN